MLGFACLLSRLKNTPRFLLVALFFAAACSLLPVWIGRYLPLLDYPGHLANLFIWRHLSDPAYGFSRYYEPNATLLPYWVQFGLEWTLSVVVSEETAQKLFLSLSIAGLPLSVALYAKQLGRDPWVAVLAFPLAWNMNVSHGFLAFIGGLPILFLALRSLHAHMSSPSLKSFVCAALWGILVYFSHILLLGVYVCVGSATALLFVRPFSLQRLLVAPLPVFPSVALSIWAQFFANSQRNNLPLQGQGLRAFVGVYSNFWGNLEILQTWTLNTLPETRDETLYSLIWLSLWLLLLLTSCLRNSRSPGSVGFSWRTLFGPAELGFVIVAILFFTLPRSLLKPFYWFAINRRIAVVLAVFALFLIRGSILDTVSHRVIVLISLAFSILYTTDIAAHYFRFNQRLKPYEILMQHVPRGKQVLPIMLSLRDPDSLVNCFNQWGSYVQIRQGGFMAPVFPVEFPLKQKKVQTPAVLPWDAQHSFRFELHERGWDYFLVQGKQHKSLFAQAPDSIRLVEEIGNWALYEKVIPKPPIQAPKSFGRFRFVPKPASVPDGEEASQKWRQHVAARPMPRPRREALWILLRDKWDQHHRRAFLPPRNPRPK